MVKTNEQTPKVPWFLAIIPSHKQAIIASYYGMYLTFFKSTADNGAVVEVSDSSRPVLMGGPGWGRLFC